MAAGKAKVAITVAAADPAPEAANLVAEAPGRGGVPRTIPLTHAQIVPDPLNARKTFDPQALRELAETMFTHGLLQPLVVAIETEATAAADAADPQNVHFQLVAGERRWRAWGLLIADGRWSADHVEECRIETADERNRMEAALIENLQRVDLNHMEAGEAFEVLGAKFHLSNKQIAAKIGRTPEYVQQHRRLTKLDPEDQERMRQGHMTFDEARATLSRPSLEKLTPTQQTMFLEILHRIVKKPGGGFSYYGRTEVHPDAKADGDLEQLVNLRLLAFHPEDHKTFRAYVALETYGDIIAQSGVAARIRDRDDADEALNAWRVHALHSGHDCLPETGQVYATPWLNGPFPLTPEAQARADAVAAQLKDLRARQDAEDEAHNATETALAKLESEINGESLEWMTGRLIGALAGMDYRAPFQATATGEISDSGNIIVLSWIGMGDGQRELAIILAAMLNRLVPVAPAAALAEAVA